ncbi:MAG: hypothetical protein KF774_15285 [Planctomyces sp.]|nr:hypothetical protein [Planctomyces sp.]
MTVNRLSCAMVLCLWLVPEFAHAQNIELARHRRRKLLDPCRCGAPALPGADCGCAAPMFTPQAVFAPPPTFTSQMCPMVETCLVPQTCTTWRDVPQTCFRQEPVVQNVPVTCFRQVTVDEGCWQQVWVPRMVTKSVPQTTIQQQVSYRTVPVTTMQRVPFTETRMVPQTRTRYVPQALPPMLPAGCCGGGPIPYGVPPLGPATLGPIVPMDDFSTAPGTSGFPALPPAGLGDPAAYNPPSVPVPPVYDPGHAAEPTPARSGAADGEWTPVQQRTAQFESRFGFRPFGAPTRQASYQSRSAELWQ